MVPSPVPHRPQNVGRRALVFPSNQSECFEASVTSRAPVSGSTPTALKFDVNLQFSVGVSFQYNNVRDVRVGHTGWRDKNKRCFIKKVQAIVITEEVCERKEKEII